MNSPLITVVSGFFGAGKTSLVTNLISATPHLRTAVILNTLADQCYDTGALNHALGESQDEPAVGEINSGCACCERSEGLLQAVAHYLKNQRYDHIIIETAGTALPGRIAEQIAQQFHTRPTVVTVLDLPAHIRFGMDEQRPENTYHLHQINAADVIVLTKTDGLPEARVQQAEAGLKELLPHTSIVTASFGAVEPHTIIGITAAPLEGALEDLPPQPLPHAFSAHTFVARPAFHPEALWKLIHETWPQQIIRSTGIFWLATRPDYAALWDQAYDAFTVAPAALWLSALSEEERREQGIDDHDLADYSRHGWDDEVGDRCNEIVVIGHQLTDTAVQSFQDCLHTASSTQSSSPLTDPFPSWDAFFTQGCDEGSCGGCC